MKFQFFLLIISLINNICATGKPFGIDLLTVNKKENLKDNTRSSKNVYSDYFDRENLEKTYDLHVKFHAPSYESRDYWDYKPQKHHPHRTVYDYSPYKNKATFPEPKNLYTYTASLSGEDDTTLTPERYHYEQNRATPPHHYDPRLTFNPPEINYIPPPKPIRASVIKLETITRSSNYFPSSDRDITTNHYPPSGNVLHHVLIENPKNYKTSSLNRHHGDYLSIESNSSSNSAIPVLPKPIYIAPTTFKPHLEHLKFFKNFTHQLPNELPKMYRTRHDNEDTIYKYPESIQDHIRISNPGKNKYVPSFSETYEPQLFTSEQETMSRSDSGVDYREEIVYPTVDTTFGSLVDIPLAQTDEFRKFKFDLNLATTSKIHFRARSKNDDLRQSLFGKKQIGNVSQKSSVELITNLTVHGLAKGKIQNANIPGYINNFNLTDVINYETRNLNNLTKTELNKFLGNDFGDNRSLRFVNLNDELSLDAKILKDTNWDGFSTTESFPTFITFQRKHLDPSIPSKAQTIGTTISTFSTPYIKNNGINTTKTKFNRNFWAIKNENINYVTSVPDVSNTTEEEKTQLKTEQPDIFTTGTVPFTQTLEFFTETTEPIGFTEEPFYLKLLENKDSRGMNNTTKQEVTVETSSDFITEDPTTVNFIETTTLTERTLSFYRKGKYTRRPKVTSFAPYPTTSETQRKISIKRNHFPRRQKPNITLSFGSKNILRQRETNAKDELSKSAEDNKKRKRKLGKRRHVFKRRRITSERPTK